jgi:shikimate kinase
MITFLIGPSRAGKSTLSNQIADQFPNIIFMNLDDEVKKIEDRLRNSGVNNLGGWPGRWERSLVIFNEADREGKDVVVDVGAGSLQTPMAFQYFDGHLGDLILITAPFATILARHPGRNEDELRRTEFSSPHILLHTKIVRAVDTSTLSEKQASEILSEYLKKSYKLR